MVVQIVILIARATLLSTRLRTATLAALRVLQSRGLEHTNVNELRKAMIAAGYGSYVKHLSEIAEVLF